MKKIKLKDYDKDYVAVEIKKDECEIVAVDMLHEYILIENKLVNPKIFGVTEQLAVDTPEYAFNRMIENLKDWVDENGYEDINDQVDYEDENIKEMKNCFRKWILDNETALTVFFPDKEIEIEL